jgi:hypothetical protein
MGNVAHKSGAKAPVDGDGRPDDEDRVAPGHMDKKQVGALAHALIAGLLTDGYRAPSPERISVSAAALPGLSDVVTFRLAVRQRALTAAAVYFRLFVPDRHWVFEGAELRGPNARFDLVWRSAGGVIVDELKTGRSATRGEIAAVREQAARELRAGAGMFGEDFLGVRVVSLGAPRTSFFTGLDGRTSPVEWRLS